MGAPILAANDLRIDVDGVAAIDGVTFAIEAKRAIVIGAPRAVFEAACGVVTPARGSIETKGIACARALAETGVAGAPIDPPLPPAWTMIEYATWSARLAGRDAKDARARAARAFEVLGVKDVSAKLGTAMIAARRATVIAGAIATGAELVIFEEPTASLDDVAGIAFARFVVDALEKEGRAWIAFAGTVAIDSPIADAAGEVIVIDGAKVVARGTARELAARSKRVEAVLAGSRDACANACEEARARVRGLTCDHHEGGARLTIDRGDEGASAILLECAERHGAIVVELRPLWP